MLYFLQFFLAAGIIFLNNNLFPVKAQVKLEENQIEKQIKKLENAKNGQLIFRAKRSALWLKSSKFIEDKKPNDVIEISLNGALYDTPKEVTEVARRNIDRSTPEGAAASFFSATKSGDVKWIVDNFVEDEQEEMKKLFKDKKTKKESNADANQIKSEFIIGTAQYNDHVILFVEQNYNDGRRVKEPMVCRKTPDGWKQTNALAEDDTFDVVFAALSTGKVFSKNEKTLDSISP
ncbi:MAG: DUF4878 domain-containing protein [Candidatus Melainabacteria bacterium]|nr:DUF4878 domain-containing protein [Candidatus Melainabacteria bacterium]